MAAVEVEKKGEEFDVEEEQRQFRLTLTHRESKGLEAVVGEIGRRAQALRDKNVRLELRGPARMPTKRLTITTRKSPCGNGTATFDRYQLKLHKRVYNLRCSERAFKQLLSLLPTPPGALVEANQIDTD